MASASVTSLSKTRLSKMSFTEIRDLVRREFDFAGVNASIEQELDDIRKGPAKTYKIVKNSKGEITEFHTTHLIEIASDVTRRIFNFYEKLGTDMNNYSFSLMRESGMTTSQRFETRNPLSLETIRVQMWIITLRCALPLYPSELTSLHVVLWNELLKTALENEAVVNEIQRFHKTILERKPDSRGKKKIYQSEFILPFFTGIFSWDPLHLQRSDDDTFYVFPTKDEDIVRRDMFNILTNDNLLSILSDSTMRSPTGNVSKKYRDSVDANYKLTKQMIIVASLNANLKYSLNDDVSKFFLEKEDLSLLKEEKKTLYDAFITYLGTTTSLRDRIMLWRMGAVERNAPADAPSRQLARIGTLLHVADDGHVLPSVVPSTLDRTGGSASGSTRPETVAPSTLNVTRSKRSRGGSIEPDKSTHSMSLRRRTTDGTSRNTTRKHRRITRKHSHK